MVGKVKVKRFFRKVFVKSDDRFYFRFIGIFLLIYLVAYISADFYLGFPSWILWFCYAGIFFIAVGMIFENPFIIAAQVSIFLFPIMFWDTDYIYALVLHTPLFGVANYMFTDSLVSVALGAQHLFVLPLGLYALYKMKIKRFSIKIPSFKIGKSKKLQNIKSNFTINQKDFWILSMVEMAVLFVLARVLTSAAENVNCSFYSCIGDFAFSIPYFIQWFIVVFALVFTSSFIMLRIFPKFSDIPKTSAKGITI